MEEQYLPAQPKTSSARRQNLKFEECEINGEKIKLPQTLCENAELFQALFSVDSWNAFTEQQRRHLMQFLPNFEENEMEEKSCTLKMLFSGEEFRFGSNPLTEFREKLNAGYYRSDIVHIQKLLKKAKYKEYLKRQRLYYYNVLKHSLFTRQKLLESAKDLQAGVSLLQPTNSVDPVAVKRKLDHASLLRRVKHRYYQELISIKKETGDSSDSSFDENYPEGFVPPPFTKKHRKQICQLEESFNAEFDQPVISTLSRPDCLDLSRLVLNLDNPFDITEDKYKAMLKQYNRNSKNLQPYLTVQSKNEVGVAEAAKPVKVRKRRTRKTPAAKKSAAPPPTTPQPLPTQPQPSPVAEVSVKSEMTTLGSELNQTLTFSEMHPLRRSFDESKIKSDPLEAFSNVDCKTSSLSSDQSTSTMSRKAEMEMKAEQDQAVAALLKEEEHEAKVNEYIKNDEKSSALLFDDFPDHIKEEKVENPTSDYLLTPESYNVALQSVVNNHTSNFKKTTIEDVKPAPVVTTSIIPEVDSIHFDPLTIDTIAETPFTNSTTVTSGGIALENTSTMARISPSVTDLDNMNVMDLGPLNVEETEPPPTREKPPPELMHNAHANFFSLIREIVCSTWDHRMDLKNLQKRIDTWYDNAVSPLNNWYTNESWPSLLQNAVTFLAGQCPEDLLPTEYVPYIEYKSNLDIYQWIGAGRDNDNKLSHLCDIWLKNKDEVASRVVEDESILPFVLHEEFEFKREQRAVSPPASRYPTDWVVQMSTPEEKEEFRKQEKVRFQNPNSPFTYRLHGCQTVVGPVNMNHAIASSIKIAKGSSLLIENRPYYVTIMALVQDAVARLPNGEGSRQDIVTLLKDSQYLSPNIINCVLHGAVTSSLEKLQLDTDPCVKYDARRKTWIYLHRSRTTSDFEMSDSMKPKTARKMPVWKLRRDYAASPSTSTPKIENSASRTTKETKVNARAVKNLAAKLTDQQKPIAIRAATSVPITNTKVEENTNTPKQPFILQTVIKDQTVAPSKEPQTVNVKVPTERTRPAVLRTSDMKNLKTVTKATRPSIIKKAFIKEVSPTVSAAVSAVKTNVVDSKSILSNASGLSSNTIMKLINAKSLSTGDAVKISPQQIVVIKQADLEGNQSTEKKRAILLKQLQQQQTQGQQRITLTSLPKQRIIASVDQLCSSVSSPSTFTETVTISTPSTSSQVIDTTSTTVEKQKQLQQLLIKQQSEIKLQKNQTGRKEIQTVALQQKVLPKQMIVVKQNQGQIVAETQNVISEEDSQSQKQVASPVVIVNKQQYQQQFSGSKNQIIQLASGQQITTQQLQQVLLKQQRQQQVLKRAAQQQQQQSQPQQIVMLKSDVQNVQGQPQIVMLKHPLTQQQQQLVMIKQAPAPGQQQKIQHKQPQTRVVQIANSAGIVTPLTTDLTKIVTSPTARLQKIPVSTATIVNQNPKSISAVGTTITVTSSKTALPTYTVVAVGQQQKVFSSNNQQLQILTPTSSAVNTSQAVVLPTTSGGLTLLQQPVQQVILPTNFTSSGMINLKTLQGLKVIPISTQSTGNLRGQPVITRLVNSNNIRPGVIQEDRQTPTSSNSINMN